MLVNGCRKWTTSCEVRSAGIVLSMPVIDLQCAAANSSLYVPQYLSLLPNSHAAETEDGSLVRVYACGS
jgi:hypothetical protein